MMSSVSQAMRRIGEVICRIGQTADKMKRQRGPLLGKVPGGLRADGQLLTASRRMCCRSRNGIMFWS